MMGNIFSIPTAANENAIKSSWLNTLGVWKDGIRVSFSTGSIWNMGSSTMGTPVGVLAVVLPSSIFYCNVFASSLFPCLVSLSLSGCALLSSGKSMRCLIFVLLLNFLVWSFFFSHSFGHPLNFGHLLNFGHPLNLALGEKIFANFRICDWCGWIGWYDTWCVIVRHTSMHPCCGLYVGLSGWR